MSYYCRYYCVCPGSDCWWAEITLEMHLCGDPAFVWIVLSGLVGGTFKV